MANIITMGLNTLTNFFSSPFLPSKSPSPQSIPSLYPQQLQLLITPHRCTWTPLVVKTDHITNMDPTPSLSPLKKTTTSVSTDILAAMCPALAHANILCFKKSEFNVKIKVEDDEAEESIVYRFRKAVMKAGILKECKRRRFFESKQDKKKRKARAAATRNRERRPQPRAPAKREAPKKKDDYESEDDNWELPEGDLPYCAKFMLKDNPTDEKFQKQD